MDILDIFGHFWTFLLKPPQPLMGLFSSVPLRCLHTVATSDRTGKFFVLFPPSSLCPLVLPVFLMSLLVPCWCLVLPLACREGILGQRGLSGMRFLCSRVDWGLSIPDLSLDRARSSMSWRIHLMWGNWTLFCHQLFRLVISVLWDHLLWCLRNLVHTNLVQWSHAFVRNPWWIRLCSCIVQLLGSRSDSVFPGVSSVHCAIALVCMPVLSVGISLCPPFIFSFPSLQSLDVIVFLFFSQLSSLVAISVLTLCCLSRESLGCLNWLVYLSLPDEVSICWSQGYCLLSLEKISWLT